MASFNEQLTELQIFVEQMQATSSSLDKVEILKKTSPFERWIIIRIFLIMIYQKLIQTYIILLNLN